MSGAGEPPPDEGDLGRLIAQAHSTRTDVDAAARHLWTIDRESRRLARRRGRQRLVSVTAALLMLVVGVGTVAGSATALPGDPLYTVKEQLERTELAVAVTDAATARAHLRHARQRLAELEAMADDPDEGTAEGESELAGRFVAALDHAARAGGARMASEVAALRTSGSLLIERVASDGNPRMERVATEPRARPSSDDGGDGTSEPPDAETGDGVAGNTADGGGSADDEPGDVVASPPETAVAATDSDDSGGDETATAEVPDEVEVPDETGTAETPDETGTAEAPDETGTAEAPDETATVETPDEVAEVVEDRPETATAHSDHGDDDDAADDAPPVPDEGD